MIVVLLGGPYSGESRDTGEPAPPHLMLLDRVQWVALMDAGHGPVTIHHYALTDETGPDGEPIYRYQEPSC